MSAIHFRCEPELEEYCEEQGKALGGTRSTFLRKLILDHKSGAALANGRSPIMDDHDAARAARRGPGIVSMKQLRAAKRKGGAK